jgi:hypothetical protein
VSTPRIERMRRGAQALDLWMEDLVRGGLASLEEQDPWEAQAARLVDAQAPGLASRVRRMGTIVGSGPDWPDRLLSQLGRLALLTRALDKLEELPEPLQHDVRQLAGIPVREAEVEQIGERVVDDWIVLAQETDDDDRLSSQRSWLWGIASGRRALHLQFVPSGGDFAEEIERGTVFRATAIFFPSAAPERVILRDRGAPAIFRGERPGVASIDAMLEDVAETLARVPWRERFFVALRGMIPVKQGGFWLRDAEGRGLRLRGEPWSLFARAGGRPVHVAGEWNGHSLRVLS